MSGSEENRLTLERLESHCRQLPVVDEIFHILERGLSKNLYYHTFSHTLDVFHESLLFASYDHRAMRECELVAIAAAYHDAGFLHQPRDNERIGARMAREAMVRHGYSDDEVSLVARMIEDTELRPQTRGFAQIPSQEISGYLLDADLSNFGRDDFFEKAELVRQEIGAPKNRASLKKVLLLMQAHRWYTPAAQALRDGKKQQNLEELKQRLSALKEA